MPAFYILKLNHQRKEVYMQTTFLFLLAFLYAFAGYTQKTETVYLNPNDSTANLYIAMQPAKQPASGILFLIPGMFQKPQDVLLQTSLPNLAVRQGLFVIIPTFKTGISSLGIDTATQASMVEIINHVKKKYSLSNQRLYVGGFSIGGTCAIKYAELALNGSDRTKPSAVFAIDSPLDFESMYNTAKRELRFAGTDKELAAENQYILNRLEKEFGGAPSDVLTAYHKGSVYSFTDTAQQAIRSLVNLPLRLYTEPDIHWWLEQGVDYSGMNAFGFAALTNELKRMGGKKVALITTTNRGFRKPGSRRHPHSWSIVEPNDLVRWLLIHQ